MNLRKNQQDFFDSKADIILNGLSGRKVKYNDFVRYSDKNNLSKSLQALYLTKTGGSNIDTLAMSIEENYPTQNVEIQDIINTMLDFDSKAKIDKYYSKKIADAKNQKAKATKTLQGDKVCLVKDGLKVLGKPKLVKELNEYIEAPRAYFGALYDVKACNPDLLELPNDKGVIVAKQMLKQLENTNIKTPTKSKKMKTKKVKLSKFEVKNILEAYNENPNLKIGTALKSTQLRASDTPLFFVNNQTSISEKPTTKKPTKMKAKPRKKVVAKKPITMGQKIKKALGLSKAKKPTKVKAKTAKKEKVAKPKAVKPVKVAKKAVKKVAAIPEKRGLTAQNRKIAKIGSTYNQAFYSALAGKKVTEADIRTARTKAKVVVRRSL